MILLPQIRKRTCSTVPVRKKNSHPAYVSLSLLRNMTPHLDILKKVSITFYRIKILSYDNNK
jgi:hypothetical protein